MIDMWHSVTPSGGIFRLLLIAGDEGSMITSYDSFELTFRTVPQSDYHRIQSLHRWTQAPLVKFENIQIHFQNYSNNFALYRTNAFLECYYDDTVFNWRHYGFNVEWDTGAAILKFGKLYGKYVMK